MGVSKQYCGCRLWDGLENTNKTGHTHPCPVRTKLLNKVSEVDCSGFPDGVDIVYQPLHTQSIQLLLKYFYTLKSRKRDGIINYWIFPQLIYYWLDPSQLIILNNAHYHLITQHTTVLVTDTFNITLKLHPPVAPPTEACTQWWPIWLSIWCPQLAPQ